MSHDTTNNITPETQNILSNEERQRHETRSLLERYTDQPTAMPFAVREAIEAAWATDSGGGDAIQIYALADLDDDLNLVHSWVALGANHLALACENADDVDVASFERSRIKCVSESAGLSCTILAFLENGEKELEDKPALAVVRFTNRQRRAMEDIKFVLEQQIAGYDVQPAEGDPDALYAAGVAKPIQEAQASFASNKMAVIWRLLGYLRPYRVRVAIGLVAAALMTIVSLLPPFLTGYLIDSVFKPFQSGELSYAAASRTAWILLAFIASTYVSLELFSWVRLRILSVTGEYVAADLRDELYAHLQRLSLTFFARKRTGSIISRVSSDTDRLWEFVAFGAAEVSLSAIKLVGLGAVLLYLDWRLGLVMVLPVPILLYAIFRHGQEMQRIFLRCWRKWSTLTDVLSDTIPGMRVVKAFNQEDRETNRFLKHNKITCDEFKNIHHVWTTFWPRLMLGVHLLVFTVWCLAVGRIVNPEQSTLTIGTFVSFLLYLTMFFQPIEVIGQMSRMLNRATSSAHRVFEVLDTEPKIFDKPDAVKLEPVVGAVAFDNVTFAYDGVRQSVRGISFDVKPGEMIGLVGPSGAGKTTVVNLIARFYDVTGGRLTIDGVDVRDLDSGSFRRQVGMVLQEPYLFHGSILENIRYGNQKALLDDVIEAARAANAHDFICKLPHGYDTVVGERGQSLSGGERQRVSIARAILSDPRILILDEATSSVDTETERKIQEALDRLIKGRTVFAIAHRLSTLTRATRLFVIKDGRIAEQGTHAELLAKEDGVYAKLHKMQQELHEQYAV